MRVRVFGKNSDDKGTQLERLTKRLLEKLGYKQIALNFVGSGGSEIDIHAEFTVPGLLQDRGVPLVGECKAYESPVTLPEWLKFLGKIFTERTSKRKPSHGLFVALSGVNGNVAGAYDDIQTHDETIELISGERLAKLLSGEFMLPDPQRIYEIVSHLTNDAITETSVGYYNDRAFWIIEFANATPGTVSRRRGILSKAN